MIALLTFGWWFGTFVIFPFSWEFHTPKISQSWRTHETSFFRGLGWNHQGPTRAQPPTTNHQDRKTIEKLNWEPPRFTCVSTCETHVSQCPPGWWNHMSTFPWVCSEAMNPMMGGGGRKKKPWWMLGGNGWIFLWCIYYIPSGKLTVCYWTWPFIVSFPIKNGDFP